MSSQRPCNGPADLPRGHVVEQWESLIPGDVVELRLVDSRSYFAFVDDVSDDGEVLWLVEDGTASRRLFLREDDVTLYRPELLGRLITT